MWVGLSPWERRLGEVLSVAGWCHISGFLDLDHPPPLSLTPTGIVGPEQLDVGMPLAHTRSVGPDPSTEIKIKACR